MHSWKIQCILKFANVTFGLYVKQSPINADNYRQISPLYQCLVGYSKVMRDVGQFFALQGLPHRHCAGILGSCPLNDSSVFPIVVLTRKFLPFPWPHFQNFSLRTTDVLGTLLNSLWISLIISYFPPFNKHNIPFYLLNIVPWCGYTAVNKIVSGSWPQRVNDLAEGMGDKTLQTKEYIVINCVKWYEGKNWILWNRITLEFKEEYQESL